MPPKKQKQRAPKESDSESDEINPKEEEEKQDEVIMGFNQNVDEFGNVDFGQDDDNNTESKNKGKEQNFVRKYNK
jgi:hypothetical protein